MPQVDLITCWPRGHDYPLWRKQIARDRDRFERVIIVFTSDNIADKSDFVKRVLPSATFVSMAQHDTEWYDTALRAGLGKSYAEWVWFAEEDYFFPTEFIDGVLAATADYDMICSIESQRIEPSFILIKREVIDANPMSFQSGGGYDNFDAFSEHVKERVRWTTPNLLGLPWHHMRGLSHNHYLAVLGSRIEYKPEEFADYLRECIGCGVELDPVWCNEVDGYLLRSSA